jgi:lipoprotein-anchoring transpeptidase ErfK/SrfK
VRGCREELAKVNVRKRLVALIAAIAVLALVACTGQGGAARSGAQGGAQGGDGAAGQVVDPAKAALTVRPDDGATKVRPDTKVAVETRESTLTTVKVVDEDGDAVAGQMNESKTAWRATENLALSTTYTVTVNASGERGPLTRETTFTTLAVPRSKQLRATSISPLDGWTVGVAQPLVVGFNRPVANRKAVQEALRVETRPGIRGAWYWIDDEYVHYRPPKFWPPGTKVTLHVELTGVDAGRGVWGAADRTRTFTIGRQQIIKVDVVKKRLTVVRNGKAIRTFPVSTGKKGWETRNGIKVIMEKVTNKKWTNESIQAPEEYTLFSKYAMRMTNSGEFIHDAPWNVGNIGAANTSHGCVGLYPKDMAWLYARTIYGDPVVVTGSPRKYTEIWNRYMDWNVPWRTWAAGNA